MEEEGLRNDGTGIWTRRDRRTAGLAAAKRRVLGLRLRYSAEKGEYTQELKLGGV